MRDVIDNAIGESPVSAVDVDAVIATGRRRTRLRRTAAGGAAGGTLAVVAVGAVAALNLYGTGAPAPVNMATAGAGAAAGPAPLHAGETLEQTRQRLTDVLTEALTAAIPGVQLSDGPTSQAGIAIVAAEELGRYDSDTVLTAAGVENELFALSLSGGAAAEAPAEGDQAAPPVAVSWLDSCTGLPAEAVADGLNVVNECEESVGPDGQIIVVHTQTCDGCAGMPAVSRYAYVTWSNARVLIGIVNDTKRGEPDATPAPLLLTYEQLVAIAVDPELTVAT